MRQPVPEQKDFACRRNCPPSIHAGRTPMADYDLDIVGVLEGTDKSSSLFNAWDYLRKYQSLFGHLRDAPFNLIEIGVMGGTSLKMWRSFFRRATIVGVDINPNCARHADERIAVEIGSQDDPAFLARICAAYPPTIVIDDGSHLANHVIYTFERMYPSLLPGGFYVVEDLSFHGPERAAKWRGFGTVSPLDYFGDIIRGRMAREAPAEPANWGTQKYVFAHTDAMTAIDSAVIFHKRPARGPIEDAEAFANEYLADAACDSGAYLRLAEYFYRHWGVTPQALRAAGQAAEMEQADARSARQLAELLAALGKPAEAVAVARRASACFAGDAAIWACLGLLRFRQGDPEGAEAAMKRAAGIDARNATYPYHLSVFLDRQGYAEAALAHAEAACRLVAGKAQEADYAKHAEMLRNKVR